MLPPEDRRLRVVANPVAGGGRARRAMPRLRQALEAEDLDYHVRWTGTTGSSAHLAREGPREGATHVAAVGGDGTVSGCAHALAGTDAVLVVVPAGSGNDFARAVGAAREPAAAAAAAARGPCRPVDVGRIRRVDGGGSGAAGGSGSGPGPGDPSAHSGGSGSTAGNGDEPPGGGGDGSTTGGAQGVRFANGLGVGLDGAVAHRVAASGRLRGKVGYTLAAVREALSFEPFPLTLETPRGRVEGSTLLAGVSNGPAHGGGFRIAPGAEVDDGALDLYRFAAVGRLTRLRHLPRVRAGEHGDLGVFARWPAKEARLELPRAVPAHLDGEPLTLEAGAYEVRVEAGALSVAAPPEA